MAAKAGAEFFPVAMKQTSSATFCRCHRPGGSSCVNSHGVAKYLLSRAVRAAGFKVVLTGEGSDEILGGYLHFRRDRPTSNGDLKPLPDGRTRPLDDVRKLLGFVPGWMETSAALAAKMRTVFSDDFVARFSPLETVHQLLQ